MVTTLTYIIIFLFGITVGSFLNVCIFRLPAGESVVAVPSHCMCCGRRLRPFELIPIFSYLFLRGSCASCGCRISPQYPLVEGLNGLLWVLLHHYFRFSPLFFLSCLLCSALIVAAVVDWRTREIPPQATLFILLLGVLRLLLDLNHWPLYVIGFFAVSLPLYIILIASGGRGMGGGDVKLMAACGLFLGWKLTLLALFSGCVLGSVIHLALMAAKKAGRVLAFGPYLAAGVFISLVWGDALIGWYAARILGL
jgi:leader peptidase (prepilin peptidase)/N-methyltransferase